MRQSSSAMALQTLYTDNAPLTVMVEEEIAEWSSDFRFQDICSPDAWRGSLPDINEFRGPRVSVKMTSDCAGPRN
jgi:hypothetical protein